MAQRVVVVGASAGGIEALQTVLGGLPETFDAAVMVVLHISPGAGTALPNILDRAGPLPAAVAVDRELIKPGRVYVCRPDHHLLVGDGHLHVKRGPRENGHRPAVDPLFRSAAYYYGPAVIGVVLSGSLSDGTAGLHTIRRLGGLAIAQDPADALYPGMPSSAIEYVGVDHIVPAAQVAEVLVEAVRQWNATPKRLQQASEDLRMEVAMMEHDDQITETDHPGVPSPWPCPDCSGVLWQIEEGSLVRFRCRVGHAWAPDDLLDVQGRSVEAALWMALRSLEDRAALSRSLAERAAEGKRHISASRFRSEMSEYEESVRVLREMLNRHEPARTN